MADISKLTPEFIYTIVDNQIQSQSNANQQRENFEKRIGVNTPVNLEVVIHQVPINNDNSQFDLEQVAKMIAVGFHIRQEILAKKDPSSIPYNQRIIDELEENGIIPRYDEVKNEDKVKDAFYKVLSEMKEKSAQEHD